MTTLAETNMTAPPLSILIIDDDAVDAHWIERSLQKCGRFEFRHSTTLADGVLAVQAQEADLILLDLGLPDGQGVGNVQEVMQHASAPIIVLTGLDDERVAIEAMALGAQDYIVKGGFDAAGLTKSIRFASERHRLVRELDEANRRESEVKDKFLSHVSHELRTPLTAVMQFVTILSDGIAGEVNPQQLEYLGIIQRNAEQLKHMIGTLMDVTRAMSGKLVCHLSRIRIEPVIAAAVECLQAVADKKGIRITADCARGLPEIVADAHRLEQVLGNLLENALKFSPDGADVRVEVRATEDPARQVLVSVVDQGCGISAEARERVFDRLYQCGEQNDASRKGLGLGLHICSEIISLHGGRIWVEGREGHGSVFKFAVPPFSLREVVRTAVTADGVVQPGVALLAVTLRAANGRGRAKGVAAVTRHVVDLFKKCMIGLTDAVLPIRSGSDERQVVLGLARTGPEGADAIANRLRSELERDKQLSTQGFEATVSCRNFAVDTACAPEQAVRAAALEVEDVIVLLEGGSK